MNKRPAKTQEELRKLSVSIKNMKTSIDVRLWPDINVVALDITFANQSGICCQTTLPFDEKIVRDLFFVLEVNSLSAISNMLCRVHFDSEERVLAIEHIFKENRGLIDVSRDASVI